MPDEIFEIVEDLFDEAGKRRKKRKKRAKQQRRQYVDAHYEERPAGPPARSEPASASQPRGLGGRLANLFRPQQPEPVPAPPAAQPEPQLDPQLELEHSYRQQRRLLEELRLSIDEVAAGRQRLEMRLQLHEHRLAEYDEQARKHLGEGREDLARVMLERKRLAAAQVEELQREIAALAGEQAQLMRTETCLEAKLESLRTRMDVLRSQHTSAKAQARLSEAAAGMSSDVTALNDSLHQVESHAAELRARSQALDQMIADGLVEGDDDPHARFEREMQLNSVDADLERLRRELAAGQPHEGHG